jgi:hypothetical protein
MHRPQGPTLLQPTDCVTLLHPLLSSSNGGRQTLQATSTSRNTKATAAGQTHNPMVVGTLLTYSLASVMIIVQCWLTYGSPHLDVGAAPFCELRAYILASAGLCLHMCL